MTHNEIFGASYCERIATGHDGKSILLCNYRVELTPSEYALVELLQNEQDWQSRCYISQRLGMRESSIPVHVANINRKAGVVSGRKLLLGNRDGEYRISDKI